MGSLRASLAAGTVKARQASLEREWRRKNRSPEASSEAGGETGLELVIS